MTEFRLIEPACWRYKMEQLSGITLLVVRKSPGDMEGTSEKSPLDPSSQMIAFVEEKNDGGGIQARPQQVLKFILGCNAQGVPGREMERLLSLNWPPQIQACGEDAHESEPRGLSFV
jgi:hypothetical protein